MVYAYGSCSPMTGYPGLTLIFQVGEENEKVVGGHYCIVYYFSLPCGFV